MAEETVVQTAAEEITQPAAEQTNTEPVPAAAETEKKEELKTDPKEIAKETPTALRKILTAAGIAENVSDEEGVKTLAADRARLSALYEAMKLGANGETAEDLVAIALTKVKDGKDIKAVITELKGQTAYSGFFAKPVSTGTGSSVSGKAHNAPAAGSMGARLAKSSARTTESPYFKH